MGEEWKTGVKFFGGLAALAPLPPTGPTALTNTAPITTPQRAAPSAWGPCALKPSSQTLGEEWGGEGVVGVVGGTTPDKANPRGRGGGLAGVDGQGYPEGFPTYNQRTVNIQSTSSQHTVNIQSTHSQHISFSKGL